MDLAKLNPWNWFKHEEPHQQEAAVPVKRENYPETQRPSGFPEDFFQLHREMDRLFAETFKNLGWPTRSLGLKPEASLSFSPKLDVASADKEYTITLEAPGLEEKDIQLDLQERTLFIRGEKRQEKEEQDKHFYRMERSYGQFQRVLEIPTDVELDGIKAKMNKGLLTLTLPRQTKSESTHQRRIEIQP
ncbi:HSP20 family protein [Marinospirillum celere]|uniref:HSP20 family protein n=1 Tax=Marinospirillum celere TaxID=1122252 RepID=A0A1I1I2D0_9GAMM|nr:Hsp20/alpha crystallin family protein [Marinospirillum celere]SFC30364.1 HSP20 family protein [Marinospirillum celere]